MKKELIQENEILDFMAGSAMIFSGFAIKVLAPEHLDTAAGRMWTAGKLRIFSQSL
jgi:hypothetical protein